MWLICNIKLCANMSNHLTTWETESVMEWNYAPIKNSDLKSNIERMKPMHTCTILNYQSSKSRIISRAEQSMQMHKFKIVKHKQTQHPLSTLKKGDSSNRRKATTIHPFDTRNCLFYRTYIDWSTWCDSPMLTYCPPFRGTKRGQSSRVALAHFNAEICDITRCSLLLGLTSRIYLFMPNMTDTRPNACQSKP